MTPALAGPTFYGHVRHPDLWGPTRQGRQEKCGHLSESCESTEEGVMQIPVVSTMYSTMNWS